MAEKRLTYSLKKLYGRQEESSQLARAYTVAQAEEGVKIVVVDGASGTGKSALVHSVVKNKKCLLGLGKFQSQRDSKPWLVLVSVMTGICNSISSSANHELYRKRLSDELTKEEVIALTNVMSGIATYSEMEVSSESLSLTTQEGVDRLKYAIRHFFRIVSSVDHSCPLVFFLDDLQWACNCTMDIFTSILTDSELKRVLFVGCCRSEEMENLNQWLGTITENKRFKEAITRISIGNLCLSRINELLSDLLKLDESETKDLAILIERRTNGNTFYILQLLDHLEQEGLIRKGLPLCRWTWDQDKILEQTSVSDNVLEIVRIRMDRLPSGVTKLLELAARIGFRFDEHILTLLVSSGFNDLGGTDIQNSLQMVVDQGLLERVNDNWFRFVHDKIYETALQLISDEKEIEQIHFQIGWNLWKHFFADRKIDEVNINVVDADEHVLFLCVSQLNLGRSLINGTNDFSVHVAKLNLQAAKKSITFSAFLPAITFLEAALSMLKKKCDLPWEDNRFYNLSLELYSSLAEMLYATGQVDSCLQTVDEILRYAKSIDDKVRAYVVRIDVLTSQSKFDSVLLNVRYVLKELGEPLPDERTTIHMTFDMQIVRRKLIKMTDDEILSLPKTNDKRKQAASRLLANTYFPVFQTDQYKFLTIVVCKWVQIILDNGHTPSSPLAFALMSDQILWKSKLNTSDIDLAFRLRNLAIALQKKLDSAATASPQVRLLCSTIGYLRKPVVLLVDELSEGYKFGMRMGDMQGASLCIMAYFIYNFSSGLPLEPLLADWKHFTKQLMEYRLDSTALVNLPLYQCVLNLTGKSDNPFDMSRETAIILNSNLLAERDVNTDRFDGEETRWSYLMQIAYFFGKMDLALEMSEKLQAIGITRAKQIHPFMQTRVFFFALIAIWYAKKSTKSKVKKWKFVREARKYAQMLRGWVQLGMINCVHKLQIVEAEMKSMDEQCSEDLVRKAYDTAIASATRAGFMQDAATANLLAGVYCRSSNEDSSSSVFHSDSYLQQARKMYSAWGAAAVVEQLESVFFANSGIDSKEFLRSSASSSFVRGRERFDESLRTQHVQLPSHLQTKRI